MELLDENYALLESGLRLVVVKALILLRNRGLLAATSLLQLFFKLFRCPDKALRRLVYDHLVADIKATNRHHRNNKLNRTLQNFMYTMLQDTNDTAAKKSLDVMIELYRKRIWCPPPFTPFTTYLFVAIRLNNLTIFIFSRLYGSVVSFFFSFLFFFLCRTDSKTVNVISEACFSKVSQIKVAALQFFLSSHAYSEDDDEASGGKANRMTVQEAVKKYSTRAAKTKKRARKLSEAIKKVRCFFFFFEKIRSYERFC